MAFNPNNYKPTAPKKLPVILLLDVSSSMMGEKIEKLHAAVVEMIKTFADQARKETLIEVAIITFGASVELHTPYTPAADLKKAGVGKFIANGMTPLGTALTMAKDMIDDPETTPKGNYRPVAVLVSDGEPNDEWKTPLERFIRDGRSQKCQRFAVAIGDRADRDMLRQFTCSPDSVLIAETAGDIAGSFKLVTMTTLAAANGGGAAPAPAAPKAAGPAQRSGSTPGWI